VNPGDVSEETVNSVQESVLVGFVRFLLSYKGVSTPSITIALYNV